MPDDAGKLSAAALYEADFVIWTEQQAAALAAGRFAELDIERLVEEVEDLGKSEFYACESQVENILLHLTKIEHVGPQQTINHWRGEIAAFRGALERRLTPSIRRRARARLEKVRQNVRRQLVVANLLTEAKAAGVANYTWDQIVDDDFFPEPHYAPERV